MMSLDNASEVRQMRKLMLALLLGLVICIEAKGQTKPDELWLVQDGKPAATIVIPEKPTMWTTKASQWLKPKSVE